MSKLVEGCALVHVFHPVAQHAVDQAGQLGRHGLDRDGVTQLGPYASELRSQKEFQGPYNHPEGVDGAKIAALWRGLTRSSD